MVKYAAVNSGENSKTRNPKTFPVDFWQMVYVCWIKKKWKWRFRGARNGGLRFPGTTRLLWQKNPWWVRRTNGWPRCGVPLMESQVRTGELEPLEWRQLIFTPRNPWFGGQGHAKITVFMFSIRGVVGPIRVLSIVPLLGRNFAHRRFLEIAGDSIFSPPLNYTGEYMPLLYGTSSKGAKIEKVEKADVQNTPVMLLAADNLQYRCSRTLSINMSNCIMWNSLLD